MEKNNPPILLVDNDLNFLSMLSERLILLGYTNLIPLTYSALHPTVISKMYPTIILLGLTTEVLPKELRELHQISTPLVVLSKQYSTQMLRQIKSLSPCIRFLRRDSFGLELLQAVDLSFNQLKTTKSSSVINQLITNQYLFFKVGATLEKIHLSAIAWMEAYGKYSKLFLKDGSKSKLISSTLKELDHQLSPYNFIRIHRSYLINQNLITLVNKSENKVLIEEQVFPLGRKYRDAVFISLI